jgi:hypothetical protein
VGGRKTERRKISMFREGTRKSNASRTGGQNLAPLKMFIKNKASMWGRLTSKVYKFNLFKIVIIIKITLTKIEFVLRK